MPAANRDERSLPASRGQMVATFVFAGLVAGLYLAFTDFGSAWLWLPMWGDRAAFLVRLVCLGAPLGALFGLAYALFEAFVVTSWRRRVAAWRGGRTVLSGLPYVVVAAPALFAVSRLLFTGGKMRTLPHRGVAVVAVFAVSSVALACAVRIFAALRAAADRSGKQRLLVVLAFTCAFALGKINQHVLPNLYEYLHSALALTSFCVALYGASALVDTLVADPSRKVVAIGVALAAVCGIVLVANLLTLEQNQNVRVALLDPKAPHARAVMQVVAPALQRYFGRSRELSAEQRARAQRLRRRARWSGPPLPETSGAHVLLVTVDALRPDHLGAYGYARGLSPNLDAFARESVVFEHAYTAAPHSSYSLSSLQTSAYVHELVDLRLPLPQETLATVLGSVGYHTAGFYTLGIFHTEGERLQTYESGAFGFARHEHTNFRAEERVDVALAELDRIVQDGEPPTFLWTHFFDVHEPYLDTSLGHSDEDRYDAEIRNVDRAFGRLLRETRARIHRPLVVVVTSDHGEEFRDHGGVYHGSTLYEEQTRVPLIVQAPGLEPRRVREPVELVDVAPTILGLVGLGTATTMRGDDLRPYAAGLAKRRAPAFAAVGHKRMAVEWPYKLIADLRFGVFELYDLSNDPHERKNLAARDPARIDALRASIYAWLDGIKESAMPGADPRALALDWGRLGDRRAVVPLSELLVDDRALAEQRIEAARILGRLADDRAKPALVRAQNARNTLVAAEAAIALGRMYDPRARPRLRALVRSEDPSLRARAAISLARLGDRAAVPALLESLRVSRDQLEREEAVRWLGRLRDRDAVEPLLELLPDYRIRHMTVIALGRLGDPRAYEPLVAMIAWENHAHVRNNLMQALGELGDPRAIEPLAIVAAAEPDLGSPSESLVRLGAIARGAVGGLDFDRAAMRVTSGLADCREGRLDDEWAYTGRTVCTTAATTVRTSLSVAPALVRDNRELLALLRARATAGSRIVHVAIDVGGRHFGPFLLDTTFHELRFVVPTAALSSPRTQATIAVQEPGETVELDHFLLVAPATEPERAPPPQ